MNPQIIFHESSWVINSIIWIIFVSQQQIYNEFHIFPFYKLVSIIVYYVYSNYIKI